MVFTHDRYCMPEYSAIREWAFNNLEVFTSEEAIGKDYQHYLNAIDLANEDAADMMRDESDPSAKLPSYNEFFHGMCIFTNDGLLKWARGEGLPLRIYGFSSTGNQEQQQQHSIEILAELQKFLDRQKIKYGFIDSLVTLYIKPAPLSERVFYGDKTYNISEILSNQSR
jgi:hypothetical protein